MYPVFLLHNTPFICLATKAAANAIQLCSLFDIDIIAVLLALGGHDSGGLSDWYERTSPATDLT
jgi:hypothetical protein